LPWGILLDGVPESSVIGLTVLQAGVVSASVLVAVFVSNVPESIAATAGLRQAGWSWPRLYGLWSGTAVLCGLASAAGYRLLDGTSPRLISFTFAFAGGAILAMVSTTMMPEAFENAGRLVGAVTTLGFAVSFFITWSAR
jgi:ZIP family zinc transporter